MILLLLSETPTVADGWGWAQTAVLIAPGITFLGAVIVAAVTYWLNQRTARRERRAKVFADALTAIEDYAEMPYRVIRRASHTDARSQLTSEISAVKSRIAFHLAWLQIEAPDVVEAYRVLDRAVRLQAGKQMTEAWQRPPLTSDAQMNLGAELPRDEIDAARDRCVTKMKDSLKARWA